MAHSKADFVSISRVKNGSKVALSCGTILEVIENKQKIDGYDVGAAEFADIKRVWSCKRLRDNRIMDFYSFTQVILLEGELAW